ncbi:hypothetical protein [Streptomyces griseoruber]|uniref:hypothetical protein n=1 Tax=Streptomyces griseoruber TaxID=1943 RepID=UPI0037A40547
MKVIQPAKRAPILLIAGVTLFAVGCSNSDENSDSAAPQKLTPLTEACGEIFTSDVISKIEDTRRGEELKKGVSLRGASEAATAAAIQELNEGSKVGAAEPCTLNGDSGGDPELIIQFAWQSGSFPTEQAQPGTNAIYESADETHALVIDCRRKDLLSTKADQTVLRASLIDRIGLNSNSAAKVLIASAKKMTAGLKCAEEVRFPEPPKVNSDLK